MCPGYVCIYFHTTIAWRSEGSVKIVRMRWCLNAMWPFDGFLFVEFQFNETKNIKQMFIMSFKRFSYTVYSLYTSNECISRIFAVFILCLSLNVPVKGARAVDDFKWFFFFVFVIRIENPFVLLIIDMHECTS